MAPRGSYNKAPKEIKHHPTTDAIANAIVTGKSDLIPQLEVRNRDDDSEETLCVLVGREKGNEETLVYMMPYVSPPKGESEAKHFLKFYKWTDEGIKEPPFSRIKFEPEILSMDPFDSAAGNSRWSDQNAKNAAHRSWLLIVWQHVTNMSLPTEKTTAKPKRMQSTRSANDASTSKKKKRKLSVPSKRREDISSVQEHIETWNELHSSSEAEISEGPARRVCRAYRSLYRGQSVPPPSVVQQAYREYKAKSATSCLLTETWFQFDARAVGSTNRVTLEIRGHNPNKAKRSGDQAKWTSSKSQTSAVSSSRDRWTIRSMPDTFPSLAEARDRLWAWMERGRNMNETEIDQVRVARKFTKLNMARMNRRSEEAAEESGAVDNESG